MSAQGFEVVILREDKDERGGQRVWRIWSRLRPEERDIAIASFVCEHVGCGASHLGLES